MKPQMIFEQVRYLSEVFQTHSGIYPLPGALELVMFEHTFKQIFCCVKFDLIFKYLNLYLVPYNF